ncbi:MBL fold metallo-hydrolase [Rhodoferax mekongensis]|uniref:MBL fold metallo-hydrolase n=1 Tax=Rhodoferax mekongensis TaxID=3068341 RepID=A0ABZ0AXH1_9BURK|nr:MBL fold metallo-hydrolase [Rhodoferax sp. TBRC 17307]WNO04010.1 MBL fold metallo-hydrolase [Rhodoferax sp. TBRC 17307]
MTTFAEYEFMPVGQGLFATGNLGQAYDQVPRFRWVYDCGTLSESALLEKGLERLETDVKSQSSGKPSLDLVVISHFDVDHLSGLADLLTRFRVETLMLPFTHLAQRLRHMFSQRPYTARADRAYYIDPIGTILAMKAVDIGQIVLVPPSTGESVPDQPDRPIAPRPPRELGDDSRQEREELMFEEGNVYEANDRDELDAMQKSAAPRHVPLRLMKADSAATYDGVWEFVPYNEPKSRSKASVDFLRKVEAKRLTLLSSTSLTARNVAIADLKKAYDAHFGDSPKARNVISLFLYSGPIGQHLDTLLIGEQALKTVARDCMWACPVCWRIWFDAGCLPRTDRASGVLYTGDGYMNKPSRWQDLRRHFGDQRIGCLVALQVMHHGARGNWFPGFASLVRPMVSVFSSDPERGNKLKNTGKSSSPSNLAKKPYEPHPHAEVMRDFSNYNPLQANKLKGVQILTTYR